MRFLFSWCIFWLFVSPCIAAIQKDSSGLFDVQNKNDVYFIPLHATQFIPFKKDNIASEQVIVGAERTHLYLPLLRGKCVGVFSNQTSVVRTGDARKYIHLVDTLLRAGIQVKKVFVPEHGLKGLMDAGEAVYGGHDDFFDIEVVSLYGNKKSPSSKDLSDIDVLIFDIQDVGVRFYTYISSLQYIMEAAIKNKITFLLLDRPNPNGFYVDGPILQPTYKSFVGLQKIPIVYGMTMVEYAQMLYLEGWLSETDNKENTGSDKASKQFSFLIVPCKNYTHYTRYQLPIKPSPNLGTMQAIYLYPSLCLLEGTKTSLGRGTNAPFECYGYPEYPTLESFSFTPLPKIGAKSPPYLNQMCYGRNLSSVHIDSLFRANQRSLFTLQWLMNAYYHYPKKNIFFDSNFFRQLVGNADIEQHIISQRNEDSIRAVWQTDLHYFLQTRKRYLLYEDF